MASELAEMWKVSASRSWELLRSKPWCKCVVAAWMMRQRKEGRMGVCVVWRILCSCVWEKVAGSWSRKESTRTGSLATGSKGAILASGLGLSFSGQQLRRILRLPLPNHHVPLGEPFRRTPALCSLPETAWVLRHNAQSLYSPSLWECRCRLSPRDGYLRPLLQLNGGNVSVRWINRSGTDGRIGQTFAGEELNKFNDISLHIFLRWLLN